MYAQLSRQKFRVTLDFDVFDDFDPHNVDWKKVFEIEGDEQLSVTIEKDIEDDLLNISSQF